MINLFVDIYSYFYRKNEINNYKKTNIIKCIICNVVFRANSEIIFLILFFVKILRIKYFSTNISNDIIVSMTSYPARIKSCWIAIYSILKQDLRPREINLYLSKKQFPDEYDDLPKILNFYRNYGLKIIFVDGDLKSHKKYLYSFGQYKNICIVTIDDDLYYNKDMIERLWEMHQKSDKSVCANIVSVIKISDDGNFESYNKWARSFSNYNPLSSNLAIGVGGILYPPSFHNISEIRNIINIKETCINADDLWLKAHQIKNNVKVLSSGYYCCGVLKRDSQRESLTNSNCSVNECGNDIQWRKICKLMNIIPTDITE